MKTTIDPRGNAGQMAFAKWMAEAANGDELEIEVTAETLALVLLGLPSARLERMETALKRILDYPVHSEPVGGANGHAGHCSGGVEIMRIAFISSNAPAIIKALRDRHQKRLQDSKKIKPGREFFEVSVDWDTGKCELDTWRVSTVRGGKITAILVAPWTWGKRSTKHGDYGWLPNIGQEFRFSWSPDQSIPMFSTKLKAWIHAGEKIKQKWYGDDAAARDQALATCRAQVTRLRR